MKTMPKLKPRFPLLVAFREQLAANVANDHLAKYTSTLHRSAVALYDALWERAKVLLAPATRGMVKAGMLPAEPTREQMLLAFGDIVPVTSTVWLRHPQNDRLPEVRFVLPDNQRLLVPAALAHASEPGRLVISDARLTAPHYTMVRIFNEERDARMGKVLGDLKPYRYLHAALCNHHYLWDYLPAECLQSPEETQGINEAA